MPIIARLLTAEEFLQLAAPLREIVFVREQQIDAAIEQDGEDPACRHYGLWRSDEFCATARISPKGKLGRMAVAKQLRGQGLGATLVTAIIECERKAGTRRLYLHSQADAIGFYQRLGFTPTGDIFQEADIPHQAMELIL